MAGLPGALQATICEADNKLRSVTRGVSPTTGIVVHAPAKGMPVLPPSEMPQDVDAYEACEVHVWQASLIATVTFGSGCALVYLACSDREKGMPVLPPSELPQDVDAHKACKVHVRLASLRQGRGADCQQPVQQPHKGEGLWVAVVALLHSQRTPLRSLSLSGMRQSPAACSAGAQRRASLGSCGCGPAQPRLGRGSLKHRCGLAVQICEWRLISQGQQIQDHQGQHTAFGTTAHM